jgi:Zn-dependent peptidase ImmA (M78 family)/DNA-binding XRE family transcriptional regulator
MTTKTTGLDDALRRVIPERIREAREARGFTTEAFGDAIGVSRQAVAQYETGQTSPSAAVLASIISVTKQPPTFFTEPRGRRAESFLAPFWRSLKRMENPERIRISRRLEWAADIVSYIENFLELPKIDLPPIEWDAENGSTDEIEDIARRVREHWGLGLGPIHNLSSVLEYHGIILVRERVSCEDMDALSRWQNGRPYILYSADVESGPRTTYNLAHELAHMILHSGVEVTSENLAKLERQANRFAGAFLLPRATFPLEVVSTSITYFKFLKERWGVAIAAMVYRCKDLGILNESQVKYLWRQMNALGIRKKEPGDEKFQQPLPTLLRSSLEMLVGHKVQSKEDIERKVNLNAEDIESLGGCDHGWLSGGKILAFTPRFKTA